MEKTTKVLLIVLLLIFSVVMNAEMCGGGDTCYIECMKFHSDSYCARECGGDACYRECMKFHSHSYCAEMCR